MNVAIFYQQTDIVNTDIARKTIYASDSFVTISSQILQFEYFGLNSIYVRYIGNILQ